VIVSDGNKSLGDWLKEMDESFAVSGGGLIVNSFL